MAKTKPVVSLKVGQYPGESAAAALARVSLRPSTQGALTLLGVSPIGSEASDHARDVNALVDELQEQTKAISCNDLSRLEGMLTIQAHTLDAMFNDMARRAEVNRDKYPDAFERYMRLALKAQSQCRATIQSVAEIKNPKPVAFVQQANITHGPQQINNGPARAENLKSANEVLEGGNDGRRLERGTAAAGSTGDLSLAAVGESDWAKVGTGEG